MYGNDSSIQNKTTTTTTTTTTMYLPNSYLQAGCNTRSFFSCLIGLNLEFSFS